LEPLSARFLIEDGKTVGRAIVQAAARLAADLVVLGARGQNPSAAVLLGAETEQTLRESAVPVLVVRQAGPETPLLDALFEHHTTAGNV
jgi:nucleotide-binding universal stress UspA family protein